MRTVYIDLDYKCHIVNNGTMKAIETDYFDGKCDTVIEGYCIEPSETGQKIYPWKDYNELDNAQRAYEKQLLEEQAAELAELDALVLELQYNTLVV